MTFSTIDIGRTGAGFARYWTDTIAHNMANLNTVRSADDEPFRARLVHAQAVDGAPGQTGRGVGVRAVLEHGDGPIITFDPAHPLANEEGYVTRPVVDIASEMTNLIMATRHYQASVQVINNGREAYEHALRMGGR